jgi:GDPmannose 4,6-dehydratase
VREFVELAFSYMGIEVEWRGKGAKEKGIARSVDSTWSGTVSPGSTLIEIDPRYYRPTEVVHLQADIAKARQKLGWEPRVTFQELAKIMVDYDAKMVGLNPPCEGIETCVRKGFDYTDHSVSLYESIGERC